jgi:hypothetical protein
MELDVTGPVRDKHTMTKRESEAAVIDQPQSAAGARKRFCARRKRLWPEAETRS